MTAPLIPTLATLACFGAVAISEAPTAPSSDHGSKVKHEHHAPTGGGFLFKHLGSVSSSSASASATFVAYIPDTQGDVAYQAEWREPCWPAFQDADRVISNSGVNIDATTPSILRLLG